MHMADSLLSPAVGLTMYAISATAIAYSVAKVKKDELCEKKIPILGIMGAFVFATQMLNFTIPGTGSSGHIGGGILLAAMLGSYPALLAISAVLTIQCLFFADGGLLALGCNIFNMGVIPCLLVYPLLYKLLVNKGMTTKRITIASIVAVVAALQLGSLGVVFQTSLYGIAELPFGTFVFLMLPIHLAIGLVEGVITAGVLCSVYKMRSEIMESTFNGTAVENGVSIKTLLAMLAVITLIAGGLLSLFVSSYPDGLEWSIERIAGTAELEIKDSFVGEVAAIQEKIAFMPGYDFHNTEGSRLGTSVAGIIGSLITFVIAGFCVLSVSFFKKRQKDEVIVA